jgi:hypothetical protein
MGSNLIAGSDALWSFGSQQSSLFSATGWALKPQDRRNKENCQKRPYPLH